jgi:cysteine-rich repeat protein
VVFSTACGNGAAEGGEQCDDGNGVAGDGCSAGCRLECETSVECEDGDACTEPRCRNSECVRPRCGYTGALCELADSTPLMQSIPGCTGRGGRVLARAIRARLHAARQQLQQARKRGDKSARTVANRVRDLVARVTVKAEKLAARDRISPACLDAVSDAAASLTRTLPPIVQRRGLCPAS